jgi:large subunit ribosomal protein L25
MLFIPNLFRKKLSTIILKNREKMKTVEIKGYKRETTGKKNSRKLRSEENVPCVLYGGEGPIHFYASSKDFKKLLYTPNVYLINVDIEGTVYKSIIQDAQFHAVEDQVLHVDFLQVSESKPIKIEIPVNVQGYAEGMRKGGKMKLNLRRLKVKALPQNLPDVIPVNIDALDVGQSIKVGELKMDNIEFLNAKSVPVVTIMITRAAKAAAASTGS